MVHVRDEAVGVRSVERTVLRPVLLVAPTRHPVKAAAVAAVVTRERAAAAVEGERPGIAAALREQLERVGVRVISPDRLAEKRDAADPCRAGAAVDPVEPAVGAPRQTVGERVGVLEAEPR